ncbi:glycosyltransferase family 4 protein [Pyrococcus kukulkanii]|uniref:Glycosyl transferase family 1 n=1 Tax=Pyrococcus kukulkanii TaxID=1609559 RepID=A0A127B9T3_9EURY|nr:glycosyltransferase family 4 protein [Pyrococcus kukulkanii]AMM53539.1 glycosyl transferase family 1 [Pyrococcus kukulkanii]
MRVLIISSMFPDKDNRCICDIFVKEQVKALSKYLDEIYVISPVSVWRRLKSNVDFRDYSIGDNVRVYFPTYVNFPPKGFLRYLWIKSEVKSILGVIKKEGLEFNVIHAHYSWPSGAVAVKLKEMFNVPVVITEHTHITLKQRIKKNDKILKWTWKNTDALIRVNKKDIQLIKDFCPSLRVYHIPNGYNPNRISPIPKDKARSKLGLSENEKILFNLAKLYPYKGHKYLIEAMFKVVKYRNDVVCFIGGEGPLKKELQQQINQLGLQEHVRLLGFVPDKELSLWMNAADLFVLPSLSEGNPTVMFEALGVGLPFVGTAVGGVPEVITSEDYGLLCPPADPECLAEKILIALEKEWDREKIRKYAEQFTWENIAKKILKVYETLWGEFDG